MIMEGRANGTGFFVYHHDMKVAPAISIQPQQSCLWVLITGCFQVFGVF